MLIELHAHGRPHKHGGIEYALELCRIAKQKGIDGICWTEHVHTKDYPAWTQELKQEMIERSPIVCCWGAELTIDIGDLLTYIGDSGVAITLAHPCKNGKRFDKKIPAFIDAMEIDNKSYTPDEAAYARELAAKWNMNAVCGSDIHLKRHVGLYPYEIPYTGLTSENMIDAIVEELKVSH